MTKLEQLMRQIIKYGPISKKELQERTGVSWGTVSGLITQLVEDKFVVPSLRQTNEVGRKAEEFDVNSADHLCIGIDLSQYGLLGVVTDLRGRIVMKLEHTFEAPEKEEVLQEIFKMTDAFLEAFSDKTIWGIGFSVQGIVEIYEGVSVLISGIKDWNNVPLKDIMKERYGLQTYTEHDPNCAMLAERSVGCLKNRQVTEATLLTFNPMFGAGVSVMTRGQLCHGVRGRAGEVGCNPVDITKDGTWHHLEDYLSANGLIKEYYNRTGKTLTYEEFVCRLEQGDDHCTAIYQQLGRYFGFALSIANNYLNPEVIILNIDGVQQQILYEEISRIVKAVSFDPDVQIVISKALLEMKAIGAAMIISEKAVATL